MMDDVRERRHAEPENASEWDAIHEALRRIENRERCSVCGVKGKYFEFDCSGRCKDCTP